MRAMNKTAPLSLVAILVTLPFGTWAASTDPLPTSTGRVERAQRQFGDVRFVMGSGQAMKWLEMYVGGNLIAAFRGFDAQAVHASPDGQYFLAISNHPGSSMAFAVLDRGGHLVFSGIHGASAADTHAASALHYCSRPGESGYWIDAAHPAVKFQVATTSATPARKYLQSVTVRGCNGKTVWLGRGAEPVQKTAPARVQAVPVQTTDVIPEGHNRGSLFIGNTIANLRGLDPTFGGRTLTLVDGRRQPLDSSPPAPTQQDPAAASADSTAQPAPEAKK
jgi:hypothetical protein